MFRNDFYLKHCELYICKASDLYYLITPKVISRSTPNDYVLNALSDE